MVMGKGGEITVKEILEIVLAAAAVLVLVVLLYTLISSSFDKDEKTVESYMDMLKEEIARADDGKVGSFDMFETRDGETRFFVVYFGDRIVVPWENMNFRSARENTNHVCACYLKEDAKETKCPVCEDLRYPASFGGSPIIYSSEPAYKIRKVEGVYEFKK